MKKNKKLLFLFPISALILSGCTFQEGWETVKGFVDEKIVQPVKDLIPGSKKESDKPEQKDEDKPAPQPAEDKKVSELVIGGEFKTDYAIGEEFDSTGLTVTAVYDDQSFEDVSSKVSFSGFDSSKSGTVVITVSFGGQTATFEVTVEKKAWSAEELKLFQDNLHGLIIPFINKDGLKVELDSSDWVTLSGAKLTENELLAYEAKFSVEEGYEDTSDEWSSVHKAFRKSAQTSEGTRYVDFCIYFDDEDGSFELQAKDDYEYSFPNVSKVFESYPLLTPFEAPAMTLPDGGYYYIAEGIYNEDYYDMGGDYYSYMYLMVWGYNASQETFDSYKAGYTGWTIYEFTSQGSTTFEATKAIGDQGQFAKISFSYTASTKLIRSTITLGLLNSWDAEGVAAAVAGVAPSATTVIPAYVGPGNCDIVGSTLVIYGSQLEVASFEEGLTTANWTVLSADATSGKTYLSPAEDITLTVQYSSYYGALLISVAKYNKPSAEWPASDIAALDLTDPLPEFEGTASSYQVYDSNSGTGILIYVEDQDAAITSYQATLVENGFVLSEGVYFSSSEHPEYYITFSKATEGAIDVQLNFIAYWPTAEIAAAIKVFDESYDDALPALEGAAAYVVYPAENASDYTQVQVWFSSYNELYAAYFQYASMLLTANFTNAGADTDGSTHYNSPDEEYNVRLGANTTYNVLMINIYNGAFVPVEVPASAAEFFEGEGISGVVVPTFDVADPNASVDDPELYNGGYLYYVNYPTEAEFNTYVEKLVANGWVIDTESSKDDDVYLQFGETDAWLNIWYMEEDASDPDDVEPAYVGFYFYVVEAD